MKISFLVLLMVFAFNAEADPKFQLGFEAGGLLALPESGGVKFGGSPIYFTEALLITLPDGWFIRPHIAAGTKLPDRSALMRVGLFGGKKIADHLALGAGGIVLQVIAKNNQYKLLPGGNVAVLSPYKWGALYLSTAIVPGAVITTTGVTFNL